MPENPTSANTPVPGTSETRAAQASRKGLNTALGVEEWCLRNGITTERSFAPAVAHIPKFQGNWRVGIENLYPAFEAACRQKPLPETGLQEEGVSLVLVAESEMEGSRHGKVVATIAQTVGFAPIEVIYVYGSVNPEYRRAFEPEWDAPMTELMTSQGAAVLQTSIGWDDISLLRDPEKTKTQRNYCAQLTSFVVDSTGNDGWNNGYISQKHNAISHFPALVVHVGAAARTASGEWSVENGSSANGPAFCAPVFPDIKLNWRNMKPKFDAQGKQVFDSQKMPLMEPAGPEPVHGTSAAAPFVSGGLAALNKRFGAYITREHMLVAVMATCDKPGQITDSEMIPKYRNTGANLTFDPHFAGFGVVNFERADKLIAHMIAHAQGRPNEITEADESISTTTTQDVKPDADGKYRYRLSAPEGRALKTTLEVHFEGAIQGTAKLISPSGTALPLVFSKNPNEVVQGLATTHGFSGENTKGEWVVETTIPLRSLEMRQHHFQEHDLVKELPKFLDELEKKPYPKLGHAKTLEKLHGKKSWAVD